MEIELRPNDPEVYWDRGDIYGAKREYSKAIGDFSEALKLHPEFTEAYAKRALTYFRVGKFESAIQDYDRILELKPEFNEVYAARGIVWLHFWEIYNGEAYAGTDYF